jgi:hypothetical protein
MFVCCECCVLSGRGLCDELITRSEESYWLWCVVCDLETSIMRRPWSTGGCCAKNKTKELVERDCILCGLRTGVLCVCSGRYMILSFCEEVKIPSCWSVLCVTAVMRLATYVITGLEPQGKMKRLDAKTDSLIVICKVTWTWIAFQSSKG